MTRIGFLLSAVLSLAIGHVRPAQAKTIRRTVDVLVIGGTTSGTSAAIAAARQGAATLIVEPTPMLGGMFSAQGVPAADGNHHLPSGLWNEFREALRAHYGGAEALATGWVSNTLFEPHVADSIFRAMAAAEPRLGRSHRPEDAVRHMGLEERVAHPARGKRFGPAVMGAQSLAKFVPQPRGQVVVTVGSRDALRREHPPEHGRGFDDQRGRPLTRRGDGRRSARSRAADNQHVDRAAYRFGLCGTYVPDCEGQHRRK